MPKTVFTGAHKILVDTLIDARKEAGLTQTELGERLGKNQKFISLIESSQRRVDALEFYAISNAIGVDPADLYARLCSKLPKHLSI